MRRGTDHRPSRPWITVTVLVAALSLAGSLAVNRMVDVTNESRFDVAVTAVETDLRDRISGFGLISLILPVAMNPDVGGVSQDTIESFMSGSGPIPAGAVGYMMSAFPLDGFAALGFAETDESGNLGASMLPNLGNLAADQITASPAAETVRTALATGRSATSPPMLRDGRYLYAHATPIGEQAAVVAFINAQRLVGGASNVAGTQVVQVRAEDVDAGITVADTGPAEQPLETRISSSLLQRRWELTITPGPDFGWQDPVVPSMATLLMGLMIAALVYAIGIQTRRRLHQQEERALLAERLVADKDRFISAVSHELRTPLTSIVGMAALLAEDPESFSGREIAEMTGIVAQESAAITMLVEDLLVAARTEDGTLGIHPEAIDLAKETCAAVDAVTAGASLVEVVASTTPAVADPHRARQIVRNLTANAIRHGGPDVKVVVGSDDGGAYVDVLDNGAGMSGEVQARMFEPYYRTPVVAGEAPSIGLGLTVARDLAVLMGGSVEYDRDGTWTSFRCTLPSAASATRPSQRAAA